MTPVAFSALLSDSDSEGEGLRTARAAGRPPEIRILKAGLHPAASEPPGTAGTLTFKKPSSSLKFIEGPGPAHVVIPSTRSEPQ